MHCELAIYHLIKLICWQQKLFQKINAYFQVDYVIKYNWSVFWSVVKQPVTEQISFMGTKFK